jgi:glycosyltransferase
VKISVITAVYNRCDTISDALRSIAEQDYEDVEHVVIDGASSDGTLAVLDEHRSQIDILISEKDNGIYDALNKGIELAKGDVVGFLHADDFFAHHRVLSKIAAAFEDPEVGAVYGDLVYVRRADETRVVRHWRAGACTPRKLAWGWMPPHPTFYVRRSIYERLGKFDTRYRIAADYDCMLRIIQRGGVRATYIPEVLVKMRLGGSSNRSVGSILRKSREDYRALKGNNVGGLGALLWKNLSKVGQFLR